MGGKEGGAGKTGGRGNFYWDAKTKIKNKQKECPNLRKMYLLESHTYDQRYPIALWTTHSEIRTQAGTVSAPLRTDGRNKFIDRQ